MSPPGSRGGWRSDGSGCEAGCGVSGLGEARPVATGGVSVAVKTGVYVDGHVAAGPDGSERSWSLGGRVTF